MKKPLLIVIIILVVILVLPVTNMIRWASQTKKPLDIIILDKTVPTLERTNHRSFTWILTHDRFVKYITVVDSIKPKNMTTDTVQVVKKKKNKGSYSFRKDYFGFFPRKPLRNKLYDKVDLRLPSIMEMADKNDALYYTDTYGVYMNDWFRGINRSRRSRKLYGGMNNTDQLYIVEMQKRNKLVILEYNTFDYPTPDLERYKTTRERLGISFNGWTGKYFSSLDSTSGDDFPIWMTSMYRREYRKPWTFKNPGVVLLKDRDIIVLEEGTTLKKAMPFIITDSLNSARFGVVNKVGFEGWFDIIDPQANHVISKFSLQTTNAGDTLLYENFLSKEFPAVITDTLNQRTYYFSGDFATNVIPFWTARFKGIEKLKGILYSEKEDDPRRFFWLYYRPLINGIFGEYYKSIKKK